MENKNIKIGLKLWSSNLHYVEEARRLWEEGFYDFLELTAVENTFDSCAKVWKALPVPYVIHGPTWSQGFRFSNKEFFESNMQKIKEVQRYADFLQAPFIIMHPGIEGDIQETARQLNYLKEPRIAIENKPYFVSQGSVCNGYAPNEIEFLKEEAGVHFCFDVAHALCAANALNQEHHAWIQAFLDLKPAIFHLVDGDIKGTYDIHLHLGKGNFPLKNILSHYPSQFSITLETEHSYADHLKDFEEDAVFIRQLTDVASNA